VAVVKKRAYVRRQIWMDIPLIERMLPTVITAACVAGSRCGIWANARAIASNLCRLFDIQQILPDAAENPVVCLLVGCWR
jgi:hypothetical protein